MPLTPPCIFAREMCLSHPSVVKQSGYVCNFVSIGEIKEGGPLKTLLFWMSVREFLRFEVTKMLCVCVSKKKPKLDGFKLNVVLSFLIKKAKSNLKLSRRGVI